MSPPRETTGAGFIKRCYRGLKQHEHIGFGPVDGDIQRKPKHFPTLAWAWAERAGTMKIGETKGRDSGLWAPPWSPSEPVGRGLLRSAQQTLLTDQDSASDALPTSGYFASTSQWLWLCGNLRCIIENKPTQTLFLKQLLTTCQAFFSVLGGRTEPWFSWKLHRNGRARRANIYTLYNQAVPASSPSTQSNPAWHPCISWSHYGENVLIKTPSTAKSGGGACL